MPVFMSKYALSFFLLFIFSFQIEAQYRKGVTVYAHTNQTVYKAGEIVYAKLYIHAGDTLMVDPMNVYADWYTAEGALLAHQSYFSNLGGAEASFVIPDKYAFNFLRVRFYTWSSIQQGAGNAYSEQVVFVNNQSSRSAAPNQSVIDSVGAGLIDLAHNDADSLIQVEQVYKNLGPKGKNEWIINNKGVKFINLSIAIVEEESFQPSPLNILTYLSSSKRLNKQSLNTAIYNDAMLQVKGKINLEATDAFAETNLIYSLFRKGQIPIINQIPILEDGFFWIKNLTAIDSAYLTFQLDYKGKGSKKFSISYNQLGLFSDAPALIQNWKWANPKWPGNKPLIQNIADESTGLREVIVNSTVKTENQLLADRYTSGLFKGGDAIDFSFLKTNVKAYPTLFHFLQGKVPGLQINFATTSGPTKDSGYIPKVGNNNSVYGVPTFYWRTPTDEVKFFLNQSPIDAATIMSISMNEIAYVKVFRPPFLGAALGAPNGAIAVYTKQGDEYEPSNRFSKLTGFSIKGFTKTMPYQYVDYSTGNDLEMIDRRKSLYWLPTLYLNHQQPSVSLVYYNNDRSKKHRIIIEGVHQNGKLIHKEWVVE
jgi:hypothetical protein